MKGLMVFGLFAMLHGATWAATHTYLSHNPPQLLVVVDTSYALKPQFGAMQTWLEQYQARSRYTRILLGTDKVLLGDLVDLKDKEAVFRTAFGRMTADNLQHYATLSVSEKILLSDGSFQPDGWEIVAFPP
ncbi:MAG: hypothetical protein BWK73_41485 [Thiothrix lacustris]|uniref:Uncharacterized protein n=1 Tax=Thiothrix lacustris TaxID=525917 RepID=A0A1Y1QD45_9GAMM|nr:MAG: hypothetical protein BWK73_41485 [Thiothrix lacustris]